MSAMPHTGWVMLSRPTPFWVCLASTMWKRTLFLVWISSLLSLIYLCLLYAQYSGDVYWIAKYDDNDQGLHSDMVETYTTPLIGYEAEEKRENTKQIGQPCDFRSFRNSMILGTNTPTLVRSYLDQCRGIIYNRVPKCASRTMKSVLTHLSSTNNFSVIYINGPYMINEREKYKHISRMLTMKHERFVLISHHYYYNFTEYEPFPQLYINVIREPVSWFQSNYNFHKYVKSPDNKLWSLPLSGCVEMARCVETIRATWGPLRFICGCDSLCTNNVVGAFQMAKRRIEQDYLVVGLMEELDDFIEVLEFLKPNMFDSLSDVYHMIERDSFHQTKTPQKDELTTEQENLLRRKLAFENDLYLFAKQRFHKLLQTVRWLKQIERVKILSRR